MTLNVITHRIAFVPQEKRPRVYYARGPRGLVTGLGGSINVETIELMAQQRRRRQRMAGSPMCRSSRCCCGIRR